MSGRKSIRGVLRAGTCPKNVIFVIFVMIFFSGNFFYLVLRGVPFATAIMMEKSLPLDYIMYPKHTTNPIYLEIEMFRKIGCSCGLEMTPVAGLGITGNLNHNK